MNNKNLLRRHDQYHLNYPSSTLVNIYYPDESCPICHPVHTTPDIYFQRFWNWFSLEVPSLTYTNKTIRYFREFCQSTVLTQDYKIRNLLLSIRYRSSFLSYDTLALKLIAAREKFQNFTLNPCDNLLTMNNPNQNAQANQPQHASQADIQALTVAVRALTGQFGAPNWGNVQNAVNNLNATVTANNNALQNRGSHVAHIPTFSGGNQDPVTWLNEFNFAAAANGWNAARKIQVVPAYLKGGATVWYQTAVNAPINAWAVAANMNNFEHAFLTRFRTPAMVEMWGIELDQRQQQPGETVDEYALSIQELYQRVNDAVFAYPDNLQARKFVSGLLPELYVAVKPFGDQTLTAAIDRAKGCELTLRSGKTKLLNYANQTSSEVNELTKLVAALTTQVTELGSKIINSGNRPPRDDNRNRFNSGTGNNNQSSRPIVCYSCGEAGHISRRCPNANTNTTATTGNPINTTTSSVVGSSNDTQTIVQELLKQLNSTSNNASQSLN